MLEWHYVQTTTTIDQAASVSLPPEALEALGVEAGASWMLKLSVAPSWFAPLKKPIDSSEFINTFESILANTAALIMN